jgi:hypothetical protein
MKGTLSAGMAEWSALNDFFRPKRASLVHELFVLLLICIIPFIGAAAILFHLTENPPVRLSRCSEQARPSERTHIFNNLTQTGRCKDGDEYIEACTSGKASASWWILFLGVRQLITWMLARATDIFVVDFLILQHSWIVRLLGPRTSLIIVQGKGWPTGELCVLLNLSP